MFLSEHQKFRRADAATIIEQWQLTLTRLEVKDSQKCRRDWAHELSQQTLAWLNMAIDAGSPGPVCPSREQSEAVLAASRFSLPQASTSAQDYALTSVLQAMVRTQEAMAKVAEAQGVDFSEAMKHLELSALLARRSISPAAAYEMCSEKAELKNLMETETLVRAAIQAMAPALDSGFLIKALADLTASALVAEGTLL